MSRKAKSANIAWTRACTASLLIAVMMVTHGCNEPTKPYEFRLGITGGEFAPDSLSINGQSAEVTRTEEVKTLRLDFISYWYEPVRSET